MGIANCFLASMAAFGLCSLFGLVYGPMHSIIPCLLVGLGVDDVFVIVQVWLVPIYRSVAVVDWWRLSLLFHVMEVLLLLFFLASATTYHCYPQAYNNANGEEDFEIGGEGDSAKSRQRRRRSIPEKVARALRHAGVGVTVTSVTDMAVFGIGATTALPSLRSYSLYTMLGILCVYALQTTLFAACLALDQRRIEQRCGILKVSFFSTRYFEKVLFSSFLFRRDGVFFWMKMSEDWRPNECSRRSLLQEVFGYGIQQ